MGIRLINIKSRHLYNVRNKLVYKVDISDLINCLINKNYFKKNINPIENYDKLPNHFSRNIIQIRRICKNLPLKIFISRSL